MFFVHSPLTFQLDEFVNKFELEGPGMVQDMDKGQKLMETFGAEFEKMEATRVEMGNEILLILFFFASISAIKVNFLFLLLFILC